MNFDILISGAGPAGLCLARALSGHGLRMALVEQQALAAIEQPAFDGREIALSQHSAQLMRTLGLWERIEAKDPNAFSALRDARVLNGPSPFAMVINHSLGTHSELGWLVSNRMRSGNPSVISSKNLQTSCFRNQRGIRNANGSTANAALPGAGD